MVCDGLATKWPQLWKEDATPPTAETAILQLSYERWTIPQRINIHQWQIEVYAFTGHS